MKLHWERVEEGPALDKVLRVLDRPAWYGESFEWWHTKVRNHTVFARDHCFFSLYVVSSDSVYEEGGITQLPAYASEVEHLLSAARGDKDVPGVYRSPRGGA